MSAPDLHPEELLDKAAQGLLSDSERAWLDRHLAQCQVCRFEQRARADFASAPALGFNVESLVTRALSGLPSQPQRATRRARSRTVTALFAAAILLSGVVSFAAVARFTGVWAAPVAPTPVPEIAPPTERVRTVIVEEMTPPPPPPPEEEAVVHLPAPVRRAVPVAVVAPIEAAVDASTLFLEANKTRVQGNHALAAVLYRDLIARFPSADETLISRATLGRLLLDDADATGAIDELDRYLESGDRTLREEVLTDRARALAILNRPADEAAAWNRLLETYPSSIHAQRAHARLEALGAH